MSLLGEHLLRVEAPHFVAGAIERSGVIVEAAPILCYMVGWPMARVWRYLVRKGWPASLHA